MEVIVSVAPVRSGTKISVDELVQEIVECQKRGASIVHLHVLDTGGLPTSDRRVFDEIVSKVRQQVDIIIEGSTGGISNLNAKQRSVCLENPFVEIASLNMGSINMGDVVYINKLADIKWWAKLMREKHILPHLEIFDLSMIYTAEKLLAESLIPENSIYGICLGFETALPANANVLFTIFQHIPHGRRWSFSHHGMKDLNLIACALELGATIVRVGLEDASNDSTMKNVEWIEKVVDLIALMGKKVTTPERTREILGIRRDNS
ncbi:MULTISPECIES: 3-keto-5-aminohexanoate cleavage protein [unclassified Thermotoga]|uniref:3-keto-5-aminohexanoate cleavage protein n=1 Tax=unclassified Thermotoga TaxID=2631113 RepID=UPI000280E746|nr:MULTISPECIES: 3-keto-5-aminohexanoate cleavage protein [unclassified Thermotoga]AIY87257.1 3-keto-5-aminohexanoate cleavage protein [Thermotoga sp. 2812B]EJX26381.1 3-keto-5-aminohexanoate cleavage protein [Thermotoga sp. EMP]